MGPPASGVTKATVDAPDVERSDEMRCNFLCQSSALGLKCDALTVGDER